jgi:hypothetical protein
MFEVRNCCEMPRPSLRASASRGKLSVLSADPLGAGSSKHRPCQFTGGQVYPDARRLIRYVYPLLNVWIPDLGGAGSRPPPATRFVLAARRERSRFTNTSRGTIAQNFSVFFFIAHFEAGPCCADGPGAGSLLERDWEGTTL